MKVFKFGGASVKNAEAVVNVAEIIKNFKGEKIGIVVSAMGKTTNSMEEIATAFYNNEKDNFISLVEQVRSFHLFILDDLFESKECLIYSDIHSEMDNLLKSYVTSKKINYDFEYDQIVSIGEVLSTKIIAAYLNEIGLKSTWIDARKLIKTNNVHREAEIDWTRTQVNFNNSFIPLFEENNILVTQGFIGYFDDKTTTLGREGSDFSAGIMAYCCDAEDVTIWKDVVGMLNADPKYFENTIKLDQISYKEAIELAYYGASVIHPKTIKPLQNKEIPLFVKSFKNPKLAGTIIQTCSSSDHLVPSYIFKMNQVLFSITPKDFSFLVEKNLSDIFDRLDQVNAKINLMQNSALNFSFVVDAEKVDIQKLLLSFKDKYDVKFNDQLELITVRHFNDAIIEELTKGKEIILQQKTRDTARLVVKK